MGSDGWQWQAQHIIFFAPPAPASLMACRIFGFSAFAPHPGGVYRHA
jgi:hypothetical protein